MASNISSTPPSTIANRISELSQEIATNDSAALSKEVTRDPKQTAQQAKTADAKKADAKGAPAKNENAAIDEGNKGVATADPTRFTDLVAKGETKELLTALLQTTRGEGVAKPTTEGSSEAGIRAFTALTAMLGTPKPNMAEAFSLRGEVIETFSALSPEAMHTLSGLIGHKGDFEQLSQLSAELTTLEALPPGSAHAASTRNQSGFTDPPTAGKTTKAEAQKALMAKYAAIVEKFFAKMSEVSPQTLLANQPAHIVIALKANMPAIIDSLRAAFRSVDSQMKAGTEVVIPSAIVMQTEAALKPVLEKTVGVEKRMAAVRSNPAKFKALQNTIKELREKGSTEAPQEIADLAREIVPYGSQDQSSSTRSVSAQRSVVGGQSSPGFAADNGPNLATADIGMLIYWIMNQVADAATDELRDMMDQMSKSLDLKKAQRAKISLMRESQTKCDEQIEKEFITLKGDGTLYKDTTLEQYKVIRQVQYCEDGSAQLPPLSLDSIPSYLREGPPAIEESTAPGEVAATQEPIDFTAFPAERAKELAEQFGVSVGDIQALYAYWDKFPQLTSPGEGHTVKAFEGWLGGHGMIAGKPFLGRDPANTMKSVNQAQGPCLVAGEKTQNQANLKKLLDKIEYAGTRDEQIAMKQAQEKGKKIEADAAKAAAEKAAAEGIKKENVVLADGTTISRYPSSDQIIAWGKEELAASKAGGWKLPEPPSKREALFNALLEESPELKAQLAQYGITNYEGMVGGIRKIIYMQHVGGTEEQDYDAKMENVFGLLGASPVMQGIAAQIRREEFDGFAAAFSDGRYGADEIRGRFGLQVQPVQGKDEVYHRGGSGYSEGDDMDGLLIGASPIADDSNDELLLDDAMGNGGAWWYHNVSYAALSGAWHTMGEGNAYESNTASGMKYGSTKKALDDLAIQSIARQNQPKAPSETPTSAPPAATPAAPPAPSFASTFANQWRAQREQEAQTQGNQEKTTAGERSVIGSNGEYVEVDANGFDAQGRQWRMGTLASLGNELKSAEESLDTMSDMNDLMQTRMQMYMERRQKAIETLSNVMKKMSDTMQTLVGNQK